VELVRNALLEPKIAEIERMIMMEVLDSWIFRLALDIRRGSFSPGVDRLCDDMVREAKEMYERTDKLRNELLNLDLDGASVRILSDTLNALSNKMKAESASRQNTLDHARKRDTRLRP